MIIGAVVAVCVVLAVLAFVFPRLSRHPERGTNRVLSAGARGGAKAPGPLGRLFAKPFRSSQRATSKSASAGRRGRSKLGR